MQVQALVAPLPAFPLMYANGLLFGTLWGGLLSWASILVPAVLCFGLAIFVARLIPLTSFDLLSYAAGLTRMRLGPFCLATGLGMAPAIFLSAAAGDLGVWSPWALGVGLAAIGALAALTMALRPVVLRWLGAPSPEPAREV